MPVRTESPASWKQKRKAIKQSEEAEKEKLMEQCEKCVFINICLIIFFSTISTL